MKLDVDLNATLLSGRRVNVDLPDGGRLGFSIPAGVSNADAFADVIRIEEWCLRGYARPMRFMDGFDVTPWQRAKHKVAVAASYVAMWIRVGWRATFARKATEARIAAVRDALINAQADGASR